MGVIKLSNLSNTFNFTKQQTNMFRVRCQHVVPSWECFWERLQRKRHSAAAQQTAKACETDKNWCCFKPAKALSGKAAYPLIEFGNCNETGGFINVERLTDHRRNFGAFIAMTIMKRDCR